MMSSSRLPSSPHSTSSAGSSISSTPRIVLSPLNPAPTPASSKDSNKLPLRPHHRGHSTSDLPVQLFDHSSVQLTTHGTSSSLPSSSAFDDSMKSTFKDRSRSPRPRHEAELQPEDSDHRLRVSWWGEEHVAKPWHDPKRKKTVPSEQTEALESTRKRVAQAVASALGTAADITHQVLFIGVDLLDLAPVPGLKPVAQLLLNIWDASELVDMNRLGCLRLTQRCADILISVRQEIFDAGDVLGLELAAPIQKLEGSFEAVHHFLMKQVNRPFLKRYLRRDEILRDIAACDSSLRDALGLFGISVQIRILKQVQETERRRQVEANALLDAITTVHPPLPSPDSRISIEGCQTPTPSYQSETVAHFTTTSENALRLFQDAQVLPSTIAQDLPPSQIIPALASIHSLQNSVDTVMDMADLRQLLRAALQTTSDVQMLEVLQIGHQEMPDAIKTLQRALERLTEQDGEGVEAPPGDGVVVEKVVEKVSLKEVEGGGGFLKRTETMISIDSSSTWSSGHSSERRRDTLHREFIESGIDALRRMSRGLETSLPSWTITKYEIDRDDKIGIGFFSDVYKGTWQGHTVAIKVLAESTPRKLFVGEIGIWKTLRHPNLLLLYGASSASGDPPWFFVSPYMKNGSLVEYLRRVELEERPSNLGIGVGSSGLSPIRSGSPGSGTFPGTTARGTSPTQRDLTPSGSRPRTPTHREWNLLRFMHEIAKGMEYLHSQGVLHGDLKGANVLVDHKYRCVISDFGQSEMKSEAYRISNTPLPHGTLRWQSPELMAGQIQLTQEMDVWAFSICCVEILTMGRIPWPLQDDDSVRYFVLINDSRPPLPENSLFNTQGLQHILRACWSTKPTQRPPFSKLVKDFKLLRKNSSQEIVELPEIMASPSPDMRPTSLPSYLQTAENDLPNDVLELNTFRRSSSSDLRSPYPVPSRSEKPLNVIDLDGYNSPPPVDDSIANERRYRLLLTHDYHPSLTLPLWDPSPVDVGAVGYLSKPRGHFVTLFNALTPSKANHLGIQSLPSIHGYGLAQTETYRQDRRTVAQKSMDVVAGFLTFRPFSETTSRHYSYPLRSGHKMAYLCTETTDYRYLASLDAPKKWFRTHIDFIMQKYGALYHIQREDLFLVIGSLSAPNYALFVSHNHPEGHAHFNVYATPKNGEPWGTFTDTVTKIPPEHGPSYDEPEPNDIIPVQATKVSNHGGPWNAVLLARLRFKPDVLEPTSK